jgi:luciferase family oxidoreductase group 1
MSARREIPYSLLDLSPILVGGTPAQALHNSLDLARHAEAWGYRRYWVAEHHNMPGIASSAPAVVIGYLAGGTKTIRVGAGGVMLPNHAPLVVAEQFGTLASLYPGRIDLGLGRAPGTDQVTTRALRRERMNSADTFPQDVIELREYFKPVRAGQAVRAFPGAGLEVPLWLLGSSLYSAQLAAVLGLPFAFASHFAPEQLLEALEIYRANFKPSDVLKKPYTMAATAVVAAETNTEAERLSSSLQLQILSLRTGAPGALPPPVDDVRAHWNATQAAIVDHVLGEAIIGDREMVRSGLIRFIEKTQIDEVMITGQIFDHAARLHSFEIAAEVLREISVAPTAT